MNIQEKKHELIKFEDGDFSLDVNVSPEEDTLWLTQEQIAILFEKAKSTINEHIKNILKEPLSHELFLDSTLVYPAIDTSIEGSNFIDELECSKLPLFANSCII